jgi:hypothetical protein
VENIPLYAMLLLRGAREPGDGWLNYWGMLLAPHITNNIIIMKKTYTILFLIFLLAGCKSTFSIAMNPDKSTFNSGTIGSVRATDNIPNYSTTTNNYSDTSLIKRDTLYRNFHLAN